MARTLCVIAVVLAVQFIGGEGRAEPVRSDAPATLKGLSPGRLQLTLDEGGGEEDERPPPLEPGRMALEVLAGIPSVSLGPYALVFSLIAITEGAPIVALVGVLAFVVGVPAATALLQTLIGNTSPTTRVRFMPAFVAGIALQVAVVIGSALFLSGSFSDPAGATRLVEGGIAIWAAEVVGIPLVQMVVLNAFRERRPVDDSVLPQSPSTWPAPPYASAEDGRLITVPLAAFRF